MSTAVIVISMILMGLLLSAIVLVLIVRDWKVARIELDDYKRQLHNGR